MKHLATLGFALGLCGFMGNAQANDSTATLDAGGIVLNKTADIVMEKEDLFVSEDKIRVAYIFRNTSKQPIETRVAFPVPEFPEEPEGDLGIDTHSNNPMGFSVTVDGTKKDFETEIKKKDGQVKVTHHWMQTFPAGEALSVVHEYKPAVGGEAGFYFGGDERKSRIKQYCIEPDMVKWLDKQMKDNYTMAVSPSFVHYILKTGANWKQGAIGKFRLTLKKQNATDKLSFCGTGVKKVDDKTFVMEKTNFTPKDNLYVMFVHQNDLNQ